MRFTFRVSGGTGVVTMNALLCYAALMEGKSLLNLDQTGLAQKGGAVLSNVILSEGDAVVSNKVGLGTADLYLVLDALGGVDPINLDRAHAGRTVAVVNTTASPTGEMIRNNALLFPSEASIRRTIDQHSDASRSLYADAGTLAEGLFGDHMATNLFVLGMAYQVGAVPLKAESIESRHRAKRRGGAAKSASLPLRPSLRLRAAGRERAGGRAAARRRCGAGDHAGLLAAGRHGD